MIEVSGTAKVSVIYAINVDMTESQWDALSESEQNLIIDRDADWFEACRGGEVDDIEVDDVKELTVEGEQNA